MVGVRVLAAFGVLVSSSVVGVAGLGVEAGASPERPAVVEAAEFVDDLGGPLAPPATHVGAETFFGAIASLGIAGTLEASSAACASGVGCVVVATGATVTAGFALGYYGAKAVCDGGAAVSDWMNFGDGGDPCNPWAPRLMTGDPGFETSARYPCDLVNDGGTGTDVGVCVSMGWSELQDLGRIWRQPLGVLYDKNGNPQYAGMWGGCSPWRYNSSDPFVVTVRDGSGHYGDRCNGHRSFQNEGWEQLVGPGGNSGNGVNFKAPWADGWFKWTTACTGSAPGTRNCGIRPGDVVKIHDAASAQNVSGSLRETIDRSVFYGAMDPPMGATVNARGEEITVRVKAECWQSNMPIVTAEAQTAWYFESAEAKSAPEVKNPCVAGKIARKIEIDWGRYNRAGTAIEWKRVVEWNAPGEWTDTAWPAHECAKVGANCRLAVDTDEASPDYGSCMWGEVVMASSDCVGVPQSPPVPQDKIYPDPEPDPSPSTTTTTTPGSGTDDRCPGPGCPNPEAPPGDPGGGGDGGGGACWPSGWGWFNPLEWVYRPVVCALRAVFWSDAAAAEIGGMWDGTAGEWVTFFDESWTGVSVGTAGGPCWEVDTVSAGEIAEVCTEPILAAEMPAPVGITFAVTVALMTLFEVIGLFARITAG